MAQKRRKGPTHYACDAYGELLETHAIIASMSRKGDCWDSRRGEFLRGAQDGARRRHGVDDPRGSRWNSKHDSRITRCPLNRGGSSPRRICANARRSRVASSVSSSRSLLAISKVLTYVVGDVELTIEHMEVPCEDASAAQLNSGVPSPA